MKKLILSELKLYAGQAGVVLVRFLAVIMLLLFLACSFGVGVWTVLTFTFTP